MPAQKKDEKKSSVVTGLKLKTGMLDEITGEFDGTITADEILDGKFGLQYHIGGRTDDGRKFNGYYKLGQDEDTGDIYISGQLKVVYQGLSDVFGSEVSGFGEGELIGKRARFEYQPTTYERNGKVESHSKPALVALVRLTDDVDQAGA